MVREINEAFPHREGYYVAYDTNFDQGYSGSDDSMYFRAFNFRYEPIRYFEDD